MCVRTRVCIDCFINSSWEMQAKKKKKNKKKTIGTHRQKNNPNTALNMVTKPRDENNKEKEKTYKNKLKTIKKMALGTYIYVQCLNQRHRLG